MDLPTELYVKIFDQSKLNDRIEMSYVSQLFNQLNRETSFQRIIQLKNVISIPLYIIAIKFEFSIPIFKLKKSIQIKHLDLRKCSLGSCDLAYMNLPYLETLLVGRVSFIGDLLPTDDTNEELKSVGCHIKSSFIYLKEFAITFNESSEIYFKLIEQLSHLKSLRLTFIRNVNGNKINNIVELKLISCNIDDDGLTHLRNFKNLEYLNLYKIHFEDLRSLGHLKIKNNPIEI
jgi:hypothetical protein